MGRSNYRRRDLLLAASAAALSPGISAQAQSQSHSLRELRLAVQSDTTSIDPHLSQLSPNQTVAAHIFEGLLSTDQLLRPAPGLATRWQAVGDDIWEFELRAGARFHDGSQVTGEDVRFSLERMPNVPGAPVPFVHLAATTRSIEVVPGRNGADIVRIRTKSFDPCVPAYAVGAWIVSAKAARNATTGDFNTGRAAIGSGPWRFVEWKPGDHLTLERAYSGMPFGRAVIRISPDDGARLATLLAGDADMIDSVPNDAVDRIRGERSLRLWNAPTARIMYLALDQANVVTPQAQGLDGKPLPANPFKDVRVRRALSLAIDRSALVARLLAGLGQTAGQLIPDGFVGFDPAVKPPPYDPAAAKQLLREAGLGNGFRLILTSPNHRYPADAEISQAIAQMWTRVGVATSVQVLPGTVLVSQANKLALSAFLLGFGSTVADGYPGESQLAASYDPKMGLGGLNRFGFSDPGVDNAFAASQAERDPAKRDIILRQASHLVCEQDVGVIPLLFPDRIWAGQAALSYSSTKMRATSNWQADLVAPTA